MTAPLAFLRSPSVTALLQRASRIAGTPLSVHYVTRNQEGPLVCGWGQCAGCHHVAQHPGGTAACRLSRTTPSAMALRQGRPIAYVCHLGFACVAVPALAGDNHVITLGPYCPMEEQRSLEDDVRAGLEALEASPVENLPFTLTDIHRAPGESVPEIGAWLQEQLAALWTQEAAIEAPAPKIDPPSPERAAPKRGAEERPERLLSQAREIAAALAAGNHAQARSLLQGHLEEVASTAGQAGIAVTRARLVAAVSATLEALARAGVPVEPAWERYPEFVAALPEEGRAGALLDRAIGVFSYLRRKPVQAAGASRLPHYPELHAIVKERLVEGVTLEFVARELGETPSAISHRLKRKFGMNFSDYVAHLRVHMAKQLIRRTKLSATEIARRVGIADQSNFSKIFKKVEGISPSAYRKAHGKGS